MTRPNLNAAFKRWFGASKIVDGDGKPLVCYHMTPGDFDRFKIGIAKTSKGHHVSGPAIWFAPDPNKTSAAHHTGAGYPASDANAGFRPGVSVMPCYLRVVNPLEIWPDEDMRKARKAAGLPGYSYYLLDSEVRAMRAMNIDGIITYGSPFIPGDLSISEIVIFSPMQAKGIFNRGTWSRRSSGLLDGLLP